MELKQQEWDVSYQNRDNFVFYPHEEVIRFAARFIRKRTSLNEFIDRHTLSRTPRVLDLGCGIGRHVGFFHSCGVEAYGIDLSPVALATAADLLGHAGMSSPEKRLQQGSITEMPYRDGFFDFVVSHGVLDSMPFQIARDAMKETRRCLARGGLFYLDLISGDDSAHYPEFSGEEVVEETHEHGTIQSYFNWTKILSLVGDDFKIRESVLIVRQSLLDHGRIARHHIILERP